MFKGTKTVAAFILITVFSLICAGMAASAAGQSDNNATATPAPTATPTPVPTPAPRPVFTISTARWDMDHVTITATNNGDPIVITAWIDNPSKKATIYVDAGETMVISTPSIQVQNGQIVSFGFGATQNGTSIDSYSATITVSPGPTPTALPPEDVTMSGLVVDADSGAPVAGANVSFKSVTYYKTYPPVATGSDGSYASPKMYQDVYKITVTCAGYQPASLTTDDKITEDSIVSLIQLKKLGGTSTPTPSPTSTLTPTSPIDPWLSLVNNPTLCIGTTSSLVAIILGSIGIYEWMERKRKEREDNGGKKDSPPKT